MTEIPKIGYRKTPCQFVPLCKINNRRLPNLPKNNLNQLLMALSNSRTNRKIIKVKSGPSSTDPTLEYVKTESHSGREKRSFWFGLSKLLFAGSIRKIEKDLKTNPEIVRKEKEIKKGIAKLKAMTDDFEEKYG